MIFKKCVASSRAFLLCSCHLIHVYENKQPFCIRIVQNKVDLRHDFEFSGIVLHVSLTAP